MSNTISAPRLADSHIHFFEDGFPGQYGTLFPQQGDLRVYEAIRTFHNIERALIVGYEGEPWAAGNNEYLARIAPERPWMAPLAFCFTANAPSTSQLVEWWKAGFYGISLYLMDDAEVSELLAWPEHVFTSLNAKKAVVSLNVSVKQMAPLRAFFERLPDAQILASHIGLPGPIGADTSDASARQLLAPLLELADMPHLGVKLSGFYDSSSFPHYGMSPVLDVLKKEFGEERLYWGSDYPPALDYVAFQQTIQAAQDPNAETQSDAIFYGNLVRLLDRVG